jgi:hypothetical protein
MVSSIVMRNGPLKPVVMIRLRPIPKSIRLIAVTQIQPVDRRGLKTFLSRLEVIVGSPVKNSSLLLALDRA